MGGRFGAILVSSLIFLLSSGSICICSARRRREPISSSALFPGDCCAKWRRRGGELSENHAQYPSTGNDRMANMANLGAKVVQRRSPSGAGSQAGLSSSANTPAQINQHIDATKPIS